jgi:hypothetical protein
MFDFLTTPISNVVGSALGFLGQQDTNVSSAEIAKDTTAANMAESQRNREFQERLSNSAYQRQVEDMKSAGLNPMLAYIKGGGASSPAGSTGQAVNAQYTSPIQGAASYRLTSAQAAKTEVEKPKVEAETSNIIKISEKIDQEISNLKTDQDRTKAVILNLAEERQNLIKQGFNLTEVGNQLRAQVVNLKAHSAQFGALTEKTGFESTLLQFDVEAAKGLGNIGREYNQVKPIIDLLRSFIRR